MTTYTSVFGDQAIPPSSNSFVQVSLTADTQLSWPQLTIGENLVASTMDVTSSGNYKLRMPSAVLVSTGQDLIINNRGSSSFTLSDYLGNEIAVISPGVVKYAYLTDNSTEQGTWAVFTFGSGTSGADAISLAGKGLVVDENKLSQSTVVMASSNSSTITLSHRSSTVTYSNSGSVTCSLLDAWVAGNGFFFNLSNQGTGQVTIDPYAFQLVDGSSNKALAPGESLTLVCTGSGWVSIGYGRSTQFQFTKLVLDITSGSPISLNSTQASNKLIEFIGTLSAPATVILPSVTAVYYTQCSYSGAFSVTLKTSAGSGVVLQPGELSIVYCDSVDVVMAQTANVPLTNLEGGTAGAIVYQSDEGTTGFSAPGVVGDLLRSGGVGAPTWTEPNQFLTLKTSPTGSTLLPTGTSAQRDVTPYFGMFRGNTDSQALEYYSGTGWSGINGSAVMNEEAFTATEGQTLITLAGRYTIGTDALSVYINGLEQGTWAYAETSTSSITFSEGLSAGDYVEIRWGTSEFLSETDASLVSYQPAGTGAVTTNVQAKLREFVSVSDYSTVQEAVTYAYTNSLPLYWPALYTVVSNIAHFHDVKHIGPGGIIRGTDTFYAEPTDAQTNVLYVGPTGSESNDGITATNPTTIGKAFSIIKSLGTEVINGVWRIQFLAGTHDDDGLTLAELPYFKNKLEIFGADVDESLSTIPTTVWSGSSSGTVYAIRIDPQYPTALVNLHIKNIKFEQWSAGACVIWASGDTLIENVHVANSPIGLWLRHGYFRAHYGAYTDCSTWGVGVQYQATGNIGSSIAGTGITFTNCANGVQVGRFSVAYVESCTFTGCDTSIEAEWCSRIRPNKNTYNSATAAHHILRGNSLITQNPGENTIAVPLTEAIPYIRDLSGSVDVQISRYGQRALHNYAGVSLERGETPITLFTVAVASQVLLSDALYGGEDFQPFRLPAYALYSPTFELEMELGIALNANAGGTLELHGVGSQIICSIAIPAAASYRSGFLKMKVMNIPNNEAGRYEFFFPPTGQYVAGVTGSLNSTAIRDSSDALLVFRLYWKSLTTDPVQFYNMRTYVTE